MLIVQILNIYLAAYKYILKTRNFTLLSCSSGIIKSSLKPCVQFNVIEFSIHILYDVSGKSIDSQFILVSAAIYLMKYLLQSVYL